MNFLPARALAFLTPAAVVLHSPDALSGEFDVVVSEIHYGPLSGEAADECVELENHGPTTVNLAGGRYTEAICRKEILPWLLPGSRGFSWLDWERKEVLSWGGARFSSPPGSSVYCLSMGGGAIQAASVPG